LGKLLEFSDLFFICKIRRILAPVKG
jgi:hypothetical protein